MKKTLKNIKEIRKKLGYSHDYIAYELNISQAAYSKLERNLTKLTVERLFELSNILEVPAAELLKCDVKNNNEDSKGITPTNQSIEDGYLERFNSQLEKIATLYEARLKDKDALIEQLKKGL